MTCLFSSSGHENVGLYGNTYIRIIDYEGILPLLTHFIFVKRGKYFKWYILLDFVNYSLIVYIL